MDDFIKHTKERDDNRSETRRLTDQHDVLVAANDNRLVSAPIDFGALPLRVLDSGCADGRWLFDLRATTNVRHEYFGTDVDEGLYPNKPPANMHFQDQSIHDAFPTEWQSSFDLVHQRLVMAAAPPMTMQSVIEKLSALIKPGGWLQLVEIDTDAVQGNGPALQTFLGSAQAMSAASGLGPNLAKDVASALRSAGLEHVEEKSVTVLHGAANQDETLRFKSTNSLCDAVPPLMMGMKSKNT